MWRSLFFQQRAQTSDPQKKNQKMVEKNPGLTSKPVRPQGRRCFFNTNSQRCQELHRVLAIIEAMCVRHGAKKKHAVFFQFVLDQCSEQFFGLVSGFLPMVGCISRDSEHSQRRGPRGDLARYRPVICGGWAPSVF